MTRKTAREIAVHIIYNTHFGETFSDILNERLDTDFYQRVANEDEIFDTPPSNQEKKYITEVIVGVFSHLEQLDSLIEKYAIGWKMNRIPIISLSIMRVVLFEILYMEDIPLSVSINEGVEISKKYQTQDITAFINGILGKFVRNELNQTIEIEEIDDILSDSLAIDCDETIELNTLNCNQDAALSQINLKSDDNICEVEK